MKTSKTKKCILISVTIEDMNDGDDLYDLECELMQDYEFFIIQDAKVKKYYQTHCFKSEDSYLYSSDDINEMSDKAQELLTKF